ncbi:MAG: hypothetical protein ACK5MD_00820 [Flavobacteriales bacterium]
MMKALSIPIIFLLFSCSENKKNNLSENNTIQEQSALIEKMNLAMVVEISQREFFFNQFLDSIKTFKIQPIDTLEVGYNVKQLESYKIGKNTIQIFKKDSLNIDWIKINSNKITIENLKIINPRVDGKIEDMFCNSIQKIKLYNFNNDEIIFLEFTSHPCNGLGCSVSDYLIYDIKNNQVNLFGNFRTANLDFYNFPFDKKLNYISTEYQGDFHGATPIHFISRVYSMDNKGKFQLEKDLKGKEYYYEIITFPNDATKKIEYKRNWF